MNHQTSCFSVRCSLINNFNAETLLVLVNAIYFKANWDVKLKIQNIPYPFFNSGSQPVDVEMMYKKSKYRYQPDLKDLKANSNLSMIWPTILPANHFPCDI
ncbi:hypothetical protein Avbf_04866 [Armadillidium vulgare]|nr:hypothetical protein Avbf_04866 [Armadillidium vulgare]